MRSKVQSRACKVEIRWALLALGPPIRHRDTHIRRELTVWGFSLFISLHALTCLMGIEDVIKFCSWSIANRKCAFEI